MTAEECKPDKRAKINSNCRVTEWIGQKVVVVLVIQPGLARVQFDKDKVVREVYVSSLDSE